MREELAEVSDRLETCSLSTVRRVASMLDLPLDGFSEGMALPQGWHFILLGADTPRSRVRSDGFPGLGVALPDLGLPRLLQSGREVTFNKPIPIGSNVTRKSFVAGIERKATRSGEVAIVTTAHELTPQGSLEVAVRELQTFFLMPPAAQRPTENGAGEPISLEHQKVVTPDDTLLFQYSALGFNSHKIHLDREYARNVEGFPDLVVNGGLVTLLLTEYLDKELGVIPSKLKLRYLAPLFSGRHLTIARDEHDGVLMVKVFNDIGKLAGEMEVHVNDQ